MLKNWGKLIFLLFFLKNTSKMQIYVLNIKIKKKKPQVTQLLLLIQFKWDN